MYMYSQKGQTLVELLLYVGIAATVLTISSLFVNTLLEARTKAATIAEVDTQGSLALQRILQSVRNAEGVTTPSTGATGEILVLDVVTGADDPTQFALQSGVLEITEGASAAVALTNSKVVVSNLVFENLSTSEEEAVRVRFTIARVNLEGRQEFSYTKTFEGGAVVLAP